VWFETQGIPAVTVASSKFADAVKAQAKAFGLEEARFVLVEHPIQDATDDEMRQKADTVINEVIKALVR